MSLDSFFDSVVIVEPLLEDNTYGDPRRIDAKIESGLGLIGQEDIPVGGGRIILNTSNPPNTSDRFTLPEPYTKRPSVSRIDHLQHNGVIQQVVCYFS